MKKYIYVITAFLTFSLFLTVQRCQSAFNYNYANPLSPTHNNLTSLLEGFLVSIQGIAGWLAVIFIVIGGVLYLTAAGKDSQITLAKNTIIYALIGFALAVAGPSLLKEIKDLVLGAGGGGYVIINANSIYDILRD